MNRKPHREICSLCHEVSRIGFLVPDEVWKLAVHVSQWNDIICLRCFARLADERGVEWDKDIKFYPCSRITQDKIIKKSRQYREKEDYQKAIKKLKDILEISKGKVNEDNKKMD